MAVDYKALKATGMMRMKQKDCISMRLKSVGGHFTAAQLRAIEQVADKYGHGYVHLTSRQGIEIPYIHVQDIEAVKADLAKGGVENGVCGPRVRTITACQGAATCPSGLIDTVKLANEFDKRFGGRELPHKFKFGFTGCHNNCLKAEENDMGIKGGVRPSWQSDNCTYCGLCEAVCPEKAIKVDAASQQVTLDEAKCVYCGKCIKSCPTDSWTGENGCVISFGGLYGNHIAIGRHTLPLIVSEEKVYDVAEATLQFFAANAKPSERFRACLERVGWDKLEKALEGVV